jgi:hypothetical protein
MESDDIALSMASRKIIPLHHLVIELHKQGLFPAPLLQPFAITKTSTLEAMTVYKDNATCAVFELSKGTKVHTKPILLKWQRFQDHLKNGDIKVIKIDSNISWAVIYTKTLCKVTQKTLCKFIMGWQCSSTPSSVISIHLVPRWRSFSQLQLKKM